MSSRTQQDRFRRPERDGQGSGQGQGQGPGPGPGPGAGAGQGSGPDREAPGVNNVGVPPAVPPMYPFPPIRHRPAHTAATPKQRC